MCYPLLVVCSEQRAQQWGGLVPRLEALCRDMGLTYRGVLPVVMPENYIALFRAPGPEEARAIVAAAVPGLEEGAEPTEHLLNELTAAGTALRALPAEPVFFLRRRGAERQFSSW